MRTLRRSDWPTQIYFVTNPVEFLRGLKLARRQFSRRDNLRDIKRQVPFQLHGLDPGLLDLSIHPQLVALQLRGEIKGRRLQSGEGVSAQTLHLQIEARLELRVTSATSVDTFGCFFIHPATVAVLESTPVAVGEQTHAG